MNDNVTSLPAAKSEFEPGDIVRLNGGEVEMTVVRVTGRGNKTEIGVAWHDEDRALIEAIFVPAALRFVEQSRGGK